LALLGLLALLTGLIRLRLALLLIPRLLAASLTPAPALPRISKLFTLLATTPALPRLLPACAATRLLPGLLAILSRLLLARLIPRLRLLTGLLLSAAPLASIALGQLLALGLRRWRIVAGDFLVKLIGKPIQLLPCTSQRLSLPTQHTLRRLLDAVTKLRNPIACLALGLSRFIHKAAIEQLPRKIERLVRLPLTGLPHRIVQLPRKQRLGNFCLFDGLTHVVQQLIETLALLGEFIDNLLPLAAVAERALLLLAILIKPAQLLR
jgi:hypothetical protein